MRRIDTFEEPFAQVVPCKAAVFAPYTISPHKAVIIPRIEAEERVKELAGQAWIRSRKKTDVDFVSTSTTIVLSIYRACTPVTSPYDCNTGAISEAWSLSMQC
jgi:hypothetical protein